MDRLVGLEMAGTVNTLILLVLAEGYHQAIFFDLAVVLALLSFAGGLVFARLPGAMAVTVADVVAAVLLGVGVVVTVISCVGVLAMPNVFDRLHYTAPATTLGAFAISLAVVVEEGWFGGERQVDARVRAARADQPRV